MRRATLIFNPHAGRRRDVALLMPELIRALADRGVRAEAVETAGPQAAGTLASLAATAGSEIVFACGGDGTIHETLQGLVGTATALGVVPIGTANALARNLKLARNPVQAVIQQANSNFVRVSVGEVSYGSPHENSLERQTRYFTVMAGAGPDGALVFSLLNNNGQKSAMGRTAYYAHAGRLFLTKSFSAFRVAYRLKDSSSWQEESTVSAMASRVEDLGGIFSRLTPGCSLHSDSLRLFLIRPPAAISLPSWFVFGQLGIHRAYPWLRVVDVEEFRCEPFFQHKPIHAQVDGEWIGHLPISVRIVPDALSLILPMPVTDQSLRSR